jgi:HEAT repeats
MLLINNRNSRSGFVPLLLLCALLTGSANGQAEHPQPEKLAYGVDRANVPDAMAKVKSGKFGAIHVDLIVRAGAPEAIPVLKEQFAHVQDPLLKAKIAAGLIRLGDKDDSYWNFLVNYAKPAVEGDFPDFASNGSHEKAPVEASPEFEAWVKAHNLTPEKVEEIFQLPVRLVLLGWSEDPRALPFLHQALSSPNPTIQIVAATGLAEIGDKTSVPWIIEACRKSPANAEAIAQALVYFDDSEAQRAVDEFIPKEKAKLFRDARANGNAKPLSPRLYDRAPNQ